MIKKIILSALIFFKINSCNSQIIWTIGPMLHVNFGGEKPRGSFAIEAAYWNIYGFYHSVDGGIEFEKNKVRIYSELQTGFGLAGIGCGPLIEFNKEEHKAHLGFQTTLWGNYFLGFDYRRRSVKGTKFNCLGTYVKVPFSTIGLDESNSNNSSSHHSWGD